MKKLFSLLFVSAIALFGFCAQISAQVMCEVIDPLGQQPAEPFNPPNVNSPQCPNAFIDIGDYDLVSPFTIYVNVHFRPTTAGENFDAATAVSLANQLISTANNYLNNMEQNEKPGPNGSLSPHVPQAKWQYKIYTENLPGDDLGGIWIEPNPNSGMYNSKVIDIWLNNGDGTHCYSGSTYYGGFDVNLTDFYFCHDDDLAWYARIMNHEFGHSLTLHHSSYCNNQCKNKDIDPEQECGPNCPEVVKCDCENPCKVNCPPQGLINRCTWAWGNNMMQQGWKQNALTPCQWETIFNYVLNSGNPKYGWADQCTEVGPTYFVQSGTNEVWDDLKLLNRNVEIETGATLTISCEVRMAKDLRFIVQRGAKLIVDGGKITNLCPNTRWGGIYVHGNATQAQPDPFGALGAEESGVVIIQNNSLIENAYTAISTSAPGFPYPEQVARWGGLIYAENSEFINNLRVAEFMKYDLENNSIFINCTMDGKNEGYAGVTIWDTDGVTFNRCRFYNMTQQGILTYDAGAIVKDGNDFQHNWRGISSRATYPYSAFLEVGDLASDPNYFLDNWFHIESNASQYGPGLSIINNEFFESNTAIWLMGPSRYTIAYNSFDQTTGGVFCCRTGSLGWNPHNYIRKNAIAAYAGIVAEGENREMQFLCNDFTANRDFILRQGNNNGPQGEIRQYQGNLSQAAGNCFTAPVQTTDILTENQTLYFRYYVASEQPCKIPTTPGNYNVLSAFNDPCNGEINFPEAPIYQDYVNVKNQIELIQNNGGQPEDELVDLLELKEHIFLKLIEGYIAEDNLVGASQLCTEENTAFSKLVNYGVQLNKGNYTSALSTLNTMPNSNEEMSTFKQIQYINIDRMQQGLEYEMPQSDYLFLETVAESDMGVKGYARAILGLLFGREFEDELQLEDGAAQRNSHQQNNSIKAEPNIMVYPNPADDQFTIMLTNIAVVSLKIYSTMGQIITNMKIGEDTSMLSVSTQGWNAGTYALQLLDKDGKIVHAELLVINK